MEDNIDKLYNTLIGKGYYTKSKEEFLSKYSNNQEIGKLYNVLNRDGLYTKSIEEFNNKYPLKKKDLSGQDSQIPGQPSDANGATSAFDFIENDSISDKAVNELKNLQNELKAAQAKQAQFDEFGAPVIVGGKQLVLPSQEILDKKIQIDDLKSTARKAFKANYIESNPEIIKDLQDEEKADEANEKIYKAFLGQDEAFTGEERAQEEDSMLMKIYDAFNQGMEESDFNMMMAKELATATDDEAKQILEYEYKQFQAAEGDIEKPRPNLMSFEGISEMAGSQARPLATTTAIGLIPGLQPAAILYSSYDAAATSYGAAYKNAYIQARSQGMDPEKAYEVASDQAKVEGETGAIEGVLGAFTGGFATKFGSKAAGKFGSKYLKPIVQKAAEGTTDMGVDAGAAMIAQITNNWSSKSKGLDVGLFDGVADEMLGEIIFSGGMKIPGSVRTVADYKKYVNGLPAGEQQQMFNDIVDMSDGIDKKIAQDKTKRYLDAKAAELENKGSQELYDLLTSNPIDYLEQEKQRLQKINSKISNKEMQANLEENIQAIDVMQKNMPDVEAEVDIEAAADRAKTNEAPRYQDEDVEEISDAKKYSEKMSEAVEKRKELGTGDDLQVDLLSEEGAQTILDEGGKIFMTKDGEAGAYVKSDGYMGGLFKNPEVDTKDAAKVLQKARVDAGGKFFDAYGTYLEDIYIKNGFRPVARLKFNEEFAPEGWQDTYLKDKPDVVFFAYDPKGEYSKGEGVVMNDYDAAYDLAKNFETTIDDTKDQQRVSSEEQIRKEPEQAELDKEVSTEEAPAGGVVQEEQEIVDPPEVPPVTQRPESSEQPEKNVESVAAYARGIIPNFDLRKSEVTPILNQLEKDGNVESALDKIDKMAEKTGERILRSQRKEIDKGRKRLKSKVSKGKFGNMASRAKSILSVPLENIPDKLTKEYLDLIKKISKPAEPSSKDLSDLEDFSIRYAKEIESKDIMSRGKSEADSFYADLLQSYNTKNKEDFISKLEEEGFSDVIVDYAKENWKSIKGRNNELYGDNLTQEEKLTNLNESMSNAISDFKESDISVDMDKFKDSQIASNIAATYKSIKESDLKDLTPSEIKLLPKIFSNLRDGMITPTTKNIANKIEASRDLESTIKDSEIFKRATQDGTEVFRAMGSSFRDILGDNLAKVVKDPVATAKKFASKNTPNMDAVVKGLHGTAVYEIFNKFTSSKDSVTTKSNKFRDAINEAFFKMKGNDLENNTLLSIYMRAREHSMNKGDKNILNPSEYIKATLNSPINNDKKLVIQNIYNQFFKDGEYDLKSIEKEIRKRGGSKIIRIADEGANETQPLAKEQSEIVRGKTFQPINGYSPRTTLDKQNLEKSAERYTESVLRPSTRSGNIEDRTSKASPLTFDFVGDVTGAYDSILTEYYISNSISEIGSLLNLMKSTGNQDLRNLAKALEKTINDDLKSEHNNNIYKSNWFGRLVNRAKANTVKSMLSGVVKMFTEGAVGIVKASMFDPNSLSSGYKDIGNIRKAGYTSKDVLTKIGSTHSDRAGLLSDEMREVIAPIKEMGRKRNLTLWEKALAAPSNLGAIRRVRKTASDVAISTQRIPDKITSVPLVLGAFSSKFKDITGADIDWNKLMKDKTYVAENRRAINKARAYADKKGVRLSNIGSPSEKALKDRDRSLWSQIQGFMRSFPANEADQFRDAIRTISDNAVEKFTGKNPRTGTFESSKEASAFLAGQIINQSGYVAIRGVLMNAVFNAILGMMGMEDEKEDIDSESIIRRGVADLIMTNIFGAYGSATRLALGFVGNMAFEEAKGEQKNNPFFGLSMSEYGSTSRFVKQFGAEGLLLGNILDSYFRLSKGEPLKATERANLMSSILPLVGFQEIKLLMKALDKKYYNKINNKKKSKKGMSSGMPGRMSKFN